MTNMSPEITSVVTAPEAVASKTSSFKENLGVKYREGVDKIPGSERVVNRTYGFLQRGEGRAGLRHIAASFETPENREIRVRDDMERIIGKVKFSEDNNPIWEGGVYNDSYNSFMFDPEHPERMDPYRTDDEKLHYKSEAQGYAGARTKNEVMSYIRNKGRLSSELELVSEILTSKVEVPDKDGNMVPFDFSPVSVDSSALSAEAINMIEDNKKKYRNFFLIALALIAYESSIGPMMNDMKN